MGIPVMVTTTVREDINITLDCPTVGELWSNIWILRMQNQHIYEAIAQFDPSASTENPYEKVTCPHHNACYLHMVFLNLFMLLFLGLPNRDWL